MSTLKIVLPLVGKKINADQREAQPKGYTSHEVTALRVGGPSGRTWSLEKEVNELGNDKGEDAGGYVVEHDAGASG